VESGNCSTTAETLFSHFGQVRGEGLGAKCRTGRERKGGKEEIEGRKEGKEGMKRRGNRNNASGIHLVAVSHWHTVRIREGIERGDR
jgi:hypothetical protein